MRIPVSTYRLQLNKQFNLQAALSAVDYLNELGISDLYLSPIFKALPGSPHGYDVVDFNVINPELGTEDDLKALADKLRSLGMGMIVDMVPNHMHIVSDDNRWWNDVLRRGPTSSYAHYFDIDWESPAEDLRGKVLQPFLDLPLGQALEAGRLQLGTTAVSSFGRNYPLRGEGSTLAGQFYHLDYWRRSFRDLNYRRFFEVSEMACLRQEEQDVFENVHGKLFEWIDKGWITGIRIDHVDGLNDPEGYLKRLRARCPDLYIVIEKVIEGGEELRETWPVQGNTGYDFLNRVNELFIEQDLTPVYEQFIGKVQDPEEVLIESKRYFLENTMQSEWRRLSRLTPEPLRETLFHFLLLFPVYRTYTTSAGVRAADKRMFEQTIAQGKQRYPSLLWDRLLECLLTDLLLVQRLQLTTTVLAAKGIEDTAFYRYFPIASRNEVGGSLTPNEHSLEEFHHWCHLRQLHWPAGLSTLSTHDTKRSEDVRARINVLSQNPASWQAMLHEWAKLNAPLKENGFPDSNDEYLFYQTLIGTWPSEGLSEEYIERICAYMNKAVKESKRYTSWVDAQPHYERALKAFVHRSLSKSHPFVASMDRFVREVILPESTVIGLQQTLLKMTLPGVPDFYQGSEAELLTLVDPDNRRPVDFARLKGRKQQLVRTVLHFRRANPDLFLHGEYVPLRTRQNTLAFARRDGQKTIIVIIGPLENVEMPEGSFHPVVLEEQFSFWEKQ